MIALVLVAASFLAPQSAKDLDAQWPSCPTVKGRPTFSVMVFGVNADGAVTSTAGLQGDPAWLDEAAAEAKRLSMPEPISGSYYGLFCTTDATPRVGYVFDQAALRAQKAPARIVPTLAAQNLLQKPAPQYPAFAKSRFVQGAVKLDIIVNPDGSVASAIPIEGPRPLFHSAVESIRRWKYKPFTVEGKPIAVETVVTVVYAVNR
jgi:TonB family protein